MDFPSFSIERLLTWMGGSFSFIAVFLEGKRIQASETAPRSGLITSPFALPFYSAGIFQWFLFGLYLFDWALLLTCFLQLLYLRPLLREYVRYQRSLS